MVATTALARRTNSGLDLVESEVESLSDFADQWSGLTESARVSLSLEWAHSMADYLTELDEQYRAGQMTRDQQRRYRGLLASLKIRGPIIERLNFYRPPVSLDA